MSHPSHRLVIVGALDSPIVLDEHHTEHKKGNVMVNKEGRVTKGQVDRPRQIHPNLRDWVKNADMARSVGGWLALWSILFAVAISGWINPHQLRYVFGLAVTPLAVLWGIRNFPSGDQSPEDASFWEEGTRRVGIAAVLWIFVFFLLPQEGLWESIRLPVLPVVVLLIGVASCSAWATTSGKPGIVTLGGSEPRRQTITDGLTAHNTYQLQLQELRERKLRREETEVNRRHTKGTIGQVYLVLTILIVLPLIVLVIARAPFIAVELQDWLDARVSIAILHIYNTLRWLLDFLTLELLDVWIVRLYSWHMLPFMLVYIYLTLNVRYGRYGKRKRGLRIIVDNMDGGNPGWWRSILRTLLSPLVILLPTMPLGWTMYNINQNAGERQIATGLFFAFVMLFLIASQAYRGRTLSDILAGTRIVQHDNG